MTADANADQLAAIRLLSQQGWTPEQIARALGLSRATVYRRLATIDKLASRLRERAS